MLWSLQVQAENVSQVSTSGLLVHRTLIKFQCVWVIFGVLNHGGSINRINVHHTKGSKQNFRGRLREPAVSSIPPSAIQEQAMHIDSFRWRWRHIFFHHLSDVIGKCKVIEVTALCQKKYSSTRFCFGKQTETLFFFYLQQPLNKDIVRSPFIFQRLLHGPNNVGYLFGCCLSQLCSVSFGILDNMQVDYKEKTRDGNVWAQENYVAIWQTVASSSMWNFFSGTGLCHKI